jgi:hypothetical protein
MIIDTPIIDRDVRERIKNTLAIEERLERARIFCNYLDTQWKAVPQMAGPFNWPRCSNDVRADIGRINERIST